MLRQRFPRATRFDLLDTRLMLEFTRAPWRLRERVQALDASARAEPIVIDEVQKAPAVLDEVHGLIESDRLRFVLCSSSARKLKRGRANLLGGRAWRAALLLHVGGQALEVAGLHVVLPGRRCQRLGHRVCPAALLEFVW